jgi:hypothetical protein
MTDRPLPDVYLSDESYRAALIRQRERISDGLPFSAVDSTAIGSKFTEAGWSLCSNELEAWPDSNDHLFPASMPQRRSPKYRTIKQIGPMDGRLEPTGFGCFHGCKIFKTKQIGPGDREKAVGLYDSALEPQP